MSPPYAWSASHPFSSLQRSRIELPPLADDEIEIHVDCCGLCRSDLHLLDNDWNISTYPLVPGHEVVGAVSALGKKTCRFQLGQRVGVGWLVDSCATCRSCLKSEENVCLEHTAICLGRAGGFASTLRVKERFAFHLPPSLPNPLAAPLLCAGITSFAPLQRARLSPGARVAVVGIGGLGHLALQYARAMGFEVWAISSSPSKEKEALFWGASDFLHVPQKQSPDAQTLSRLKALRGSFDFLLCTASGSDLPWKLYLDLLAPNASACLAGVPGSEVALPVELLVVRQLHVFGSNIGSCREMEEMFAFSAAHQIAPAVEVYPFSQVNEAIERLRQGLVRYRVVLQHKGLDEI